MSRKNKTQAARDHLLAVKSLGCIVCRKLGLIALGETYALAHHITEGFGMGQMRDDFKTIPLCAHHHTGTNGISVHGSPALFRETFGHEVDLLAQTEDDLKTFYDQRVAKGE